MDMERVVQYECKVCGSKIDVTRSGGVYEEPVFCCGVEASEASAQQELESIFSTGAFAVKKKPAGKKAKKKAKKKAVKKKAAKKAKKKPERRKRQRRKKRPPRRERRDKKSSDHSVSRKPPDISTGAFLLFKRQKYLLSRLQFIM